jgi:WD40 repeat protein
MRRRYLRYGLIPTVVIAGALALLLLRHKEQGDSTVVARDKKPQVYVEQGHGRPILSVTWSPDGRHVISGGSEGVVKVWSVASGREERSMDAHEAGRISSVSFLPDGKRFVTAGADSTVRIWDLNTMSETRRFKINSPLRTAVLASNSDRLLGVDCDSTAYVWNIESAREIKRFTCGPKGSLAAALSASGQVVLVQGPADSAQMVMRDASTGRTIREFHTDGALTCAGLDPSGTRIVSGAGNALALLKSREYGDVRFMSRETASINCVEIWNTLTGARISKRPGHRFAVSAIQFLPDGKHVLTCGLDSMIKVWNIEDGTLFREFPPHSCSILAASLSPNGHQVLVGGSDGKLRLLDLESGQVVREYGPTAYTTQQTAFVPDGNVIRVAAWDRIWTWDMRTGRRLETILPGDSGNNWHFSPDMNFGLGLDDAGNRRESSLRFWSLDRRKTIDRKPHRILGFVTSAWAFSDDGRYCVVQTNDSTCAREANIDLACEGIYTRWDMRTGREAGRFTAEDVATVGGRDLAVSADGRYALGKRCMADVDFYDFTTNRKTVLHDTAVGRFDPDGYGGGMAGDIVLSSDGREAVVSRRDGTVEFWDTQIPRITRSFRLDEVPDTFILTPDKRLLIGHIVHSFVTDWRLGKARRRISRAFGKSFAAWDTQTGKLLREFVGHDGWLNGEPTLSPDGRYLASTSTDGTARLWNRETGKEVLQFISFLNGEWIAVTPEGYYTASVNGDAFLNVRTGSKITGIEPYRSTFYQPAVVEAALRLGDSEAAISEVLGCKDTCITIADLPDMEPPLLSVTHPGNGDTLLTVDTTLVFHVEDRNSLIKAVRVYVNGRPIAGNPNRGMEEVRSGIRLDIPEGKKSLDLAIPLRLDNGDNLITITALGKAEGVDSLHIYASVAGAFPEQVEVDTVWILAVGVNKYQDKKLRSLNYCVNDAQAIVRAFKRQEGVTCRGVMSMCLSDVGPKKPTVKTIVDNLGFLHQAKERDLAVLFLAGHGANDADGEFYFLPSDAEVVAPNEFNTSKAVSSVMLESAVEVAARRFVFMDACHSGDWGVDLMKIARTFKDDRVLILMSSEGNKPSEESDSLKHGFFTYALIRGLDGDADLTGFDGRVTAMELIAYVSDCVAKLTRQQQNPVFWAPGGLTDYVVAINNRRPGNSSQSNFILGP